MKSFSPEYTTVQVDHALYYLNMSQRAGVLKPQRLSPRCTFAELYFLLARARRAQVPSSSMISLGEGMQSGCKREFVSPQTPAGRDLGVVEAILERHKSRGHYRHLSVLAGEYGWTIVTASAIANTST